MPELPREVRPQVYRGGFHLSGTDSLLEDIKRVREPINHSLYDGRPLSVWTTRTDLIREFFLVCSIVVARHADGAPGYDFNQGSSRSSLAVCLFSGSHWSILLAKFKNSSLSSPPREGTVSRNLTALGTRCLNRNSPRRQAKSAFDSIHKCSRNAS